MRYRYASLMVIVTGVLFAVVSLMALTTDWFESPDAKPDPNSHSTQLDPPPITTTPSTVEPAASRGAPRTAVPAVLERIAHCESGGEVDPYRAKNHHSTASGKYQVLNTTWDGYFGYVRAMDAPPWVQEQFALELYRAQGTTPWNASRSCWR